MPIGLKRGRVELYDHDPQWETAAAETIGKLKAIFGETAVDIQHVGSTAIRLIKAKPIIDIAVGVRNFDDVTALIPALENAGWYKSKLHAVPGDILFCDDDESADTRTYHVHIVIYGGMQWKNYLRFRDYLNENLAAAREYEAIKANLAEQYPNDRNAYTGGKDGIVSKILRQAQTWALFNTIVTVTVDRPLGSRHPDYPDMIYPVNYGYIPDEIAPDGGGLDVYVLGVSAPVRGFTGRVVGIVYRENDVEDKLVAAPEGVNYTQNEIAEAVHFTEQHFSTKIWSLYQKSCGVIVYRLKEKIPEYLLLFQQKSRTWSFPKGHMEAFESEEQTALRETGEEIGLLPELIPGFKTAITYPVDGITKTVVFFLARIGGEPTPDNGEISEFRWVSKNEAARLIGNKDYLRVLGEAEEAMGDCALSTNK
jgi:GrpB-like predicted nucleotidyltransferase (UPF0157 family)/inorganic pyrophosphatase/8-oxo-dGTP pyrophosphatase MutT (NUDIX family)